MRSLIAVTLLALAALTVACSPSEVRAASTPALDWSGYTPEVRATVEGYVAAGDCDGMQAAFDVVAARGSVDLMTWLDERMRDASCY